MFGSFLSGNAKAPARRSSPTQASISSVVADTRMGEQAFRRLEGNLSPRARIPAQSALGVRFQ